MSERRSVFILFIGIMLCISLWQISLQDLRTECTSCETTTESYANNNTKSNTTSLNAAPMSTASLDILTEYDKSLLINLTDFDYIINKGSCDKINSIDDVNGIVNKPPIAVVLVHSAPQNWEKRNVIRNTWGRKDFRVQTYFLLGAVNTSFQQELIKAEDKMYRDIIQGNFIDAYRNMTYKHIMALKWFVYNCPKLKYLIKTDDDVLVNTPALYDFLEANTSIEQNFLFCSRVEAGRIKRTYRSKWRVSPQEYHGRYYPPYCPGFSIVYSNDVVWRLYREAQRTPYFWIDDVHITGTLAQHLNLSITSFGKFYMNESNMNDLIDGKIILTDLNPMFLFTEPNLKETNILMLWNIIENSYR